jgi:retron-type reverse transcriptase
MWNGFLTMFLEEELKKFNHAYMPRVGTSTALKDLILKVLDKKYIYEFDIKGFFNNVDITNTMTALRQRGMPNKIALKLQDILMMAPENLSIGDEDIEKNDYDMQLA